MRTYIGHLRNIEECLSTISNNLSSETNQVADADKIDQSCLYLLENLVDVVVNIKNIGRRAMFLTTTLNTLARIYAVDTFDAITARKNFQSMASLFVTYTSDICLRNKDKEHATDMFESLFMNFARDNLIEKCLKRLFSKKPTLQRGNFMCDY